jgi:uncharacterized membrane protein (UPF0127 family)
MSKGFGWAAVALAVTAMASTREQWATPHVRVVFPDMAVVNAEVADAPTSRERGLMFRPDLAPSQGMLFVFEEPGYHPFWMKNCLISLDIIWLDEEGRVLSIAESVPPCRLPDCEPPCGSNACPAYPHHGLAKYVVEVVSGFAKAHHVRPSDRIVLRGLNG